MHSTPGSAGVPYLPNIANGLIEPTTLRVVTKLLQQFEGRCCLWRVLAAWTLCVVGPAIGVIGTTVVAVLAINGRGLAAAIVRP
jgi:hypothetical protein